MKFELVAVNIFILSLLKLELHIHLQSSNVIVMTLNNEIIRLTSGEMGYEVHIH